MAVMGPDWASPGFSSLINKVLGFGERGKGFRKQWKKGFQAFRTAPGQKGTTPRQGRPRGDRHPPPLFHGRLPFERSQRAKTGWWQNLFSGKVWANKCPLKKNPIPREIPGLFGPPSLGGLLGLVRDPNLGKWHVGKRAGKIKASWWVFFSSTPPGLKSSLD